jgi:hypothetical protein
VVNRRRSWRAGAAQEEHLFPLPPAVSPEPRATRQRAALDEAIAKANEVTPAA